MKAAPFAYVRPTRLGDVVAELVRADEDGGGKVIAGGQSLVPVLAMRLGRPSTLVDITDVDELKQVDLIDGSLRVGAAVRQRRVERDFRGVVPLLSQALPWVGHREIRSRGTVCGSLAHADPAAEMPAVASCLGATLEVTGPGGARRIAAEKFFSGAMTTCLGPTEVVTAVRIPLPRQGDGFGFAELARRHGDFAVAGVAVRVRTRGGTVEEAAVTAFGVSDRPRYRDLRDELQGAVERAGVDAIGIARELGDAVTAMADQIVTTAGDSHGSSQYRRRVLRALATRELVHAYQSSLEPPR
ncbi:molybdopterin dehydrogenase [Intrasporangium chromatireducens Q5-1]|uniref:Molybdopterin dehydrogenase n=1 Tax=Intrasporangium chromatireducens Q5-1 TaxID=584657 RepID=W9GJ86_9MICO|nr:FAD binding domain-containing protein [Intrasporangium chromatireducens]EWT06145.1 molybdopterin dehydrogenase [Intrasporangium chromatireducens Q5-1]